METKPGDLEGLAKSSGKAVEKEAEATSTPKDPAPKQESTAPLPTEDVPDPDEDDLDDLDGQFPAKYQRTILNQVLQICLMNSHRSSPPPTLLRVLAPADPLPLPQLKKVFPMMILRNNSRLAWPIYSGS
jgi:hypothetical protein